MFLLWCICVGFAAPEPAVNARSAGQGLGLLGMELEAQGDKVQVQEQLDKRLASIWDHTQAGDVVDVTEGVIEKCEPGSYEEFTGDRYNLVEYQKRDAKGGFSNQPLSGQNQFVMLDNILTREECEALDADVVENWEHLDTRYRAADVYVMSLPELSKKIEQRLEPYVPDRIVDEFGLKWDLVGVNNGFFRLIRYVNSKSMRSTGDHYPMHYDLPGNQLNSGNLPGVQDEPGSDRGRNCKKARTFLTFNMYLNGKEKFDDGLFSVYKSPSVKWFTLHPEAGRAFLFRQGQTKGYLHDAEAIDLTNHENGYKSIIRVDFVYKLNEEDSDPELLRKWEKLKENPCHTCPHCPEMFTNTADQELHDGIHKDPTTEDYEAWRERLDAAEKTRDAHEKQFAHTHAALGDTHAALGDTHAALGDTHAALGDTHAAFGDTRAALFDTGVPDSPQADGLRTVRAGSVSPVGIRSHAQTRFGATGHDEDAVLIGVRSHAQTPAWP